jgi:hypothetical protein
VAPLTRQDDGFVWSRLFNGKVRKELILPNENISAIIALMSSVTLRLYEYFLWDYYSGGRDGSVVLF